MQSFSSTVPKIKLTEPIQQIISRKAKWTSGIEKKYKKNLHIRKSNLYPRYSFARGYSETFTRQRWIRKAD